MLHSPRSPAISYLQRLIHHLPAVRDGDVEAVHQARVATRRLREVMPLFASQWGREAGELEEIARTTGRALGRVRELDVMCQMLTERGTRVPSLAPATAVVRSELEASRSKARRRMIKQLESIEVDRLTGLLPRLTDRWQAIWSGSGAAWAVFLRERLSSRAREVRAAVHHASGVYFPRRAHRVRVRVKQLRYAVEIASATALWRAHEALADLRRVQSILGNVHDLQVLHDRLEGLAVDSAFATHLRELRVALQHDAQAEFRAYFARRERLLAVCEACEQAMSPARRFVRLPRALFVASFVPAGLALIGTRARPGH